MVKQGVLIETLTGYNNYKAVYEYHLGKPLNYTNGRPNKKKQESIQRVCDELKRIQDEQPILSDTKADAGSMEVIVNVKGVSLEIKNATVDCVVALVKELNK